MTFSHYAEEFYSSAWLLDFDWFTQYKETSENENP